MIYSPPTFRGETKGFTRVKTQDLQRVLKFSHLGITFVLTLGFSAWLGIKVDERFGTSPTFTFLLALVGFGAGFYYLYREVYGPAGVMRGKGGRAGNGDGTGDASGDGAGQAQ